MQVEDIVEPDRITRVPLVSKQIAGVMNLRGRVVTVIDLKQCLGNVEGSNITKISSENGANGGEPEPYQRFSITVEKNHSL